MSFICAVSWLDANHLQPKQLYKPQQHSPKPPSMGTAELPWLPGRALGHGQAARGAGRAGTGLPAHNRHGTSQASSAGKAPLSLKGGGEEKKKLGTDHLRGGQSYCSHIRFFTSHMHRRFCISRRRARKE